MSDLNSIPQEFYNDNRKRFEAETTPFDLKGLKDNKCSHFFYRKSWGEIECQNCRIGYLDNHRFILKDGKVQKVL